MAELLSKRGKRRSFGYIDKRGEFVFTDTQHRFNDLGSFDDGLAPVQVGGKWGYIEKLKQENKEELSQSESAAVPAPSSSDLFPWRIAIVNQHLRRHMTLMKCWRWSVNVVGTVSLIGKEPRGSFCSSRLPTRSFVIWRGFHRD